MDAFKLRCILFFLFISISYLTFGQNEYLSKPILLRTGKFKLDSLLHTVTQQTGVVFSYNAKKFDTKQRINISSEVNNVKSFLEALKKQNGFSIKVIENYAVISSAPQEVKQKYNLQLQLKAASKPENLKRTEIQKASNVPQLPQVVKDSVRKETLDTIPKKPTISEMTSTQEKYYLQVDSLKEEPKPMVNKNQNMAQANSVTLPSKVSSIDSAQLKNQSRKMKPSKSRTPLRKIFFLKGGATLDESSFMGTMIQAGLPAVYGTAAIHSNLLASHIRYGGGASFKLSSGLRLHLVINNGAPERSGFFTDSLGSKHPIAVKSNLFRAGLGVEFSLKGKFVMQLISNFNQLTTTYFIDQAQSDLSLFKRDGDGLFYAISPPYLMTNTFSSNSDSNVKTWIGLQINFLYRIDFN